MRPTKALTLLALVSVAVLVGAAPGCKKKAVTANASQPLQESFQTAGPEVKQAIEVVTTSLKAGNYAEATKALAPVVEQRVLTEPQKQAVGIALQQMNQAIAADPSLDTREMYELRAKMFQATRRGSRF
jgi:hypothetical protein